MAKVIIRVDPHKLSATIEVVASQEELLGQLSAICSLCEDCSPPRRGDR